MSLMNDNLTEQLVQNGGITVKK
jgi:hypothetical protein